MNTTYFLDLVAGNVLGTKTSPAIPTAYYLGLSTTTPALDGTGVSEPATSKGYARVKLSNLGEPSDGVVTNTAEVEIPESTADWGTVTHFVIYDAATGGNLLMYGKLKTSRNVTTGSIMTFKSGALNLTVQNPSDESDDT